MTDAAAMEAALLQWVTTFPLTSTPPTSWDELADGVILCEVVQQLAPKTFSLSSIRPVADPNPLIRESTLRRLVDAVAKCYANELHLSEPILQSLDCRTMAATNGDAEGAAQLAQFVQCVLGIAIRCEKKRDYITKIMALPHVYQKCLMKAIEEIMHRQTAVAPSTAAPAPSAASPAPPLSSSSSGGAPTPSATPPPPAALRDQEQAELRTRLAAVEGENKLLRAERQRLNEAVLQLQHSADDAERRASDLAAELQTKTAAPAVGAAPTNSLLSSLASSGAPHSMLDVSLEAHRAELAERDALIADLRRKSEDLHRQSVDARALRDEVEILREKAAHSAEMEERLARLKKRAEEATELRAALKAAEQRALEGTRSGETEEAVARATQLKQQLDTLKTRFQETQLELTSANARLSALTTDKAVLEEQITQYREENHALRNAAPATPSAHRASAATANSDDALYGGDMHANSLGDELGQLDEALGADESTRALIAKLKQDVATHQEGADTARREAAQLRDKVAQAARDVEAAQREAAGNRQANQAEASRAAALQARVDTLNAEVVRLSEVLNTQARSQAERSASAASGEVEALRKQLAEAQTAASSAEASRPSEDMARMAEELTALRAERERLHGLLRNAKTMLNASKENPELKAAQGQLAAREQELLRLKRAWEESKEAANREQELVLSAVYNVGLELARSKARFASSGGQAAGSDGAAAEPLSFLARKRLAQQQQQQQQQRH